MAEEILPGAAERAAGLLADVAEQVAGLYFLNQP
jgi:hypothetical protein